MTQTIHPVDISRMVRRVIGTRCATVTNGWNVGSTITYPPTGRELRLSLFRTGGRLGHKFWHHPQDGTLFASDAQMNAWLIERGFLVEHYSAQWCPVHRKQHRWCHHRSPSCAVSGGYAYPGCEEAQAEWDAQDWTWSERVCADCGAKQWEPNWLQDVSMRHHGRVLCTACVKA